MDVQKSPPAVGLFSRRFWVNEIFSAAENRTTALFYSALAFTLALLFARAHAIFGAYPFALAYLCAATRRVPIALLGACVGCLTLGERGYVYLAVCVAAFLLRLLLSHPRAEGKYLPACHAYFDEEPPLRAAAACVCGLLPAVYELLVGGLSFASIAFSVSMILLPTLSCVLYIWFFESRKTLLASFGAEEEILMTHPGAWVLSLSLASLAFTFVLSLREFSILGIAPAYLAAAFFCFLFARQWGVLRGGVAALFCAAGTLAPAYLPAFAALALTAALFARAGIFPMLVTAVAAGEVVAYLFTGVESVLSFLPEILLCATLVYPFFKNFSEITAFGDKTKAREEAAAEESARRQLPSSTRLIELSAAYAEIGDILERLSVSTIGEEAKRRGEAHRILAQGCRITADTLADAARQEAREWEAEPEMSSAAAAVLAELGVPARHVTVFGGSHRILIATGMRWGADHPAEEAVCRRLGEACACRFGTPIFEAKGGAVDLRLESTRLFAVEEKHAAAPIRGEEVSGDAFSTFTGKDGAYYALLSDGMGSGREAAITAGICGAFLRQMLGAGMSKGNALRSLNTLLCERGKECSATIDLIEIDLYRGRACFIKSGAAISYVKRGDSLFRIRAATAPVGILGELDAEKVFFDLQAGDVIVMLSDGISPAPDDALWLCDMLCNGWEEDTQNMADKILSAARRRSDQADDMTVALLQVTEA